jgi:hypothetical protein
VCRFADIIFVWCSVLVLSSVKYACVCVCVCVSLRGDVLETVDTALNEKCLKQNCRLHIDNTRENSVRCGTSVDLPCGTVAVWYCYFLASPSLKWQAILFVTVRDAVTGRSVSFCNCPGTTTVTIRVYCFCLSLSVSVYLCVCLRACLPACAWCPLQLLKWMADCLWSNLRAKFIHFKLFLCAINEAMFTVNDGVGMYVVDPV